MKRNPIINDGLEKAIGTIIGTLKKGTHFTTQDITGKLKESYREEYKKNEESIREDIKYMFHAFI
ncbi:MAG: hypothetical protein M1276_01200 [Deltaproteobacteria bacterium]|nr:hypothetical protein [Deltaproteobacteria bacterium]